MLEPRVTPMAQSTPNYYLDQIDVAVELPMGPAGPQGAPGTIWIADAGAPPTDQTYPEGTLFLAGDGQVYVYENGQFVPTGVDLIPDVTEWIPHDHDYLPLIGGTLTGPLEGTDAAFSGSVTVPSPDLGTEAVNLDYLTNVLNNLNLRKFFGDASGNAISTGTGGWGAGQQQAIYQYSGGISLPPGVTGPTVGLTMRQSNGYLTQFICDVNNNMWFARTQAAGSFGQWSSVTPFVRTTAPVDPANGGPAVPNGTIWIQLDASAD